MSGPHPDPLELAAHLEPAAVRELGTKSETVLQASAAVSLKRIADALETLVAPASGFGLNDLLSENHLWNLGRAFGNGQRT